METEIFRNTPGNAGNIISSGGLVAVPTETVYGLAGNGLDEAAVEKIYEVKGRPSVKPLSLMVSGKKEIDRYCFPVPEAAEYLADRFWPGPLTIVLTARDSVPEIVRAGGPTVGLRCPANDLTLAAIREAGVPFAAPSANPSGMPSPKNAETVLDYFDGQIDAVIDGGECLLGRESTLIDMSSVPYRILRAGALSSDEIADALAERIKIVGITGPSGCGKTSALEAIEESTDSEKWLVIDCDRLYHDLLDSSELMNSELISAFPGAEENGKADRKKLSNLVFSDAGLLERLNKITHRHITDEIRRRLREFAMSGGRYAVLDASELLGSPAEGLCCATVAVLAPKEMRLTRIAARDGISREDAIRRIRAQHDDDYYRLHASYTVENSADIDSFKNKIIDIIKGVTENA